MSSFNRLRRLSGKIPLNSFSVAVFKRKIFVSSTQLSNDVVKPVFSNVQNFPNKTAIYDNTGSYTYSNIFVEAKELSMKISRRVNGARGERVLFLCPNDVSYVITLWAIWMSGQIAVPLSPMHPQALLQYYIKDTDTKLIITSPEFRHNLENLSQELNIRLFVLDENLRNNSKVKNVITEDIWNSTPSLDFYQNGDAMILYTSGTTGNPKGVVLTHKNLSVQIRSLVNAWKWHSNDVILHTLPLHHIHGTINCLFCPLSVGATTVMLPKFDAKKVWSYLLNETGDLNKKKVTVFMAVPTVYAKLIEEHDKFTQQEKDKVKRMLENNVRLMVSGSAPLPNPLYQKWLDISGHRLLERYGMTEIGMCLSNLYDSDREPGYVGLPLPSVSVAIADPDTEKVLLQCYNENGNVKFSPEVTRNDVTGQLLVKGNSVFRTYYNKPEATKKEFTKDGWFKTGDLSEYVKDKNKFRMLGRMSIDIIKSGGYKLSALQIETKLLAHPKLKECAVIGVPDDVYGEKVAAVVVLADGEDLNVDELRNWALQSIPRYSLPSVLKVVQEIPKNAMGKVNKKDLRTRLF
ncbi:malonate--CoA ligase ACSF3, mitochondrial-like [Cylas formicarius]|uniref:malonate--CoA ligase ACSF3, mitochondrial-like n=1 Tax=Cylas formicarius TaxID=197179 RepID=UPI002958893A|nr:malonate--CoA ligase ACSF3, mitochondrial-like [Cylas formicarius]